MPQLQPIHSPASEPDAVAASADTPISGTRDYDLHGVVGIRLLDAYAEDVAAVDAQLGPIVRPLEREPDIVVRFVDRLPMGRSVRLLGIRDAAYTDAGFFLLRSAHKVPARVLVPFESIGQSCEIVCERGLPAVPLLIPIINLTALARGALPIHASALRYHGHGVLVTGWSKGGKTESLLAFMANGAEYIGDEWTYVIGGRMHGIPEPLRVWDWHLAELPRFRERLSWGTRARLYALRTLAEGVAHASGTGTARASRVRRGLHRVANLIERQCHTDLHPRNLFAAGSGEASAALETVIFIGSHEAPEITAERMDAGEVAERMVFSLEEERATFLSFYHKFRFAFPGQANRWVDGASRLERERLHEALDGKRCFRVDHPYPVSIPALFERLRPLVEP